jgi:hypothetical protein
MAVLQTRHAALDEAHQAALAELSRVRAESHQHSTDAESLRRSLRAAREEADDEGRRREEAGRASERARIAAEEARAAGERCQNTEVSGAAEDRRAAQEESRASADDAGAAVRRDLVKQIDALEAAAGRHREELSAARSDARHARREAEAALNQAALAKRETDDAKLRARVALERRPSASGAGPPLATAASPARRRSSAGESAGDASLLVAQIETLERELRRERARRGTMQGAESLERALAKARSALEQERLKRHQLKGEVTVLRSLISDTNTAPSVSPVLAPGGTWGVVCFFVFFGLFYWPLIFW